MIMDSSADFPNCPICGSNSWTIVHGGPVRDGAFGSLRAGRVARCGGCGVDRLAESACLPDIAYATATYRQSLGQSHDLESHFGAHDELARFTLETIWPRSLRGRRVADIGCGGGASSAPLRFTHWQAGRADPWCAYRADPWCAYPEVLATVYCALDSLN